MKINFLGAVLATSLLTGCAYTDVQSLTQTSFKISTRGAPACSAEGTRNAALRSAAVEVIKKGGDRFVLISDEGSQGYARGVYSPYGGVISVVPLVHNNQDLVVQMLSSDDPGYDNEQSARQVLGADWQTIATEGALTTCT